MSDPAIPEWAKRAAGTILEQFGGLLNESQVEHMMGIIASEYSTWLCESLNGLTRYDCRYDGMRKSNTGTFLGVPELASALNLDIDTNGRGFRPKGTT